MKQSDGIELDDEETFTELKRNAVEMIKNVKSWMMKIKAYDAQEQARWCDELLDIFKISP